MRHHAETSATTIADLMLADLRLSHHTLVQQFDGISLRPGIRCGEAAVSLFAAIDLLFLAMFRGFVPVRISPRQAGHFGSQPDALGVATRLAAGRLREAGIVLEPLLRSAGLSLSQINKKDVRIGVASQIMFLELAAQALGFRLARDADIRQMGLLYYAAASSETLGEASF
jgi:hypothetical protein